MAKTVTKTKSKAKDVKLTVRQKAMLKELEGNYNNITHACKAVGICRKTHYDWLNDSKQYKKEYEDIAEGLLDRAETILMERLSESDTALIFFLKTKGKMRGYIERMETVMSGNVDIKGYDEFFTT